MSSNVLIIYEGEKTEKNIFNNIQNLFFDKTNIVFHHCSAGENIYMLWKTLKEDEFQTNVVEVIKEYLEKTKRKNNPLKDFSERDFSEIFLFFDYDRHVNNLGNPNLNDAVILEMLTTFNDETDLGKLYINYPMAESIRDVTSGGCCYRRCYIPLDKSGEYKNIVADVNEYQDYKKYFKEEWSVFCLTALMKSNCIVNDTYSIIPRATFFDECSQLAIYKQHYIKFIKSNRIAILNSIPLFLLEYFKEDFWDEMIVAAEEA